MEAYWQAKAELFGWPGLRAAVVNIDDVHGASLVGELIDRGTGALDVWTVSAAGAPARLSAHAVGYDARGLGFEVRVYLALADGTAVSVQLSRAEADRLELHGGDVVHLRRHHEHAFAA